MVKIFYTSLFFLVNGLITVAQPVTHVKKNIIPDTFCDSLRLILINSKDGFIAYRYNEKQGSVSIGYNTTLPSLGFERKFVQTGNVTPFKMPASSALPYFIATSVFSDLSAANQFFSTIKNKTKSCLKPVAQDSAIKAGYTRYTSFQVSKAMPDSFVTIELIMLTDPKSYTVIFRLFHSKAIHQKGIMRNPPVAVNTNKNHYNSILPLMLALIEYSPTNFTSIRGNLLQNEKWKPTYTSIVSFSNFSFPKIEYVTNNLWNQYTTNLFIKDLETATRRYNELAAEIEQCKTSISFQRYDNIYSKATDKWWYYEHHRSDTEGSRYKNTVNLTLKKFEYGEGYYITFEFRKSSGN
ncbi:MAG: hypothetical protein IPN29_22060 [Saprospiraceae bacterium]|nr:hypothetical protein [Saprospiraceae bacterium]